MTPTVRTLDQIMAELGTVYDPQVNSIRQRQSLIPEQVKQEEQGLEAKQQTAFGNILDSARRRGTGVAFGGIPLGEQAKYTATEFLPALARLKQSGREQAMTLEDAILGIQERRQNQAMGVRQYEQQRLDAYDSEQRQLAESRRQSAASGGGFSPTFGNFTDQWESFQQAPPAQDEIDAQYLGRLKQLPKSQQVQIIAGIRNGAKADGSSRNARLYTLGKQLGYWKF